VIQKFACVFHEIGFFDRKFLTSVFEKSAANLILKVCLGERKEVRLELTIRRTSSVEGFLDKVNFLTEHQDYNKFDMTSKGPTPICGS